MRKGIILAGGTGSRLSPLTLAVSKQLLSIYDKPLVYYPLSTLMLTGIKDVLIICQAADVKSYRELLSDGSQWGIRIEFAVQEHPKGLPEAYLIGENFLGNSSSVLILGDNIFFGANMPEMLMKMAGSQEASISLAKVKDPRRFGVATLDREDCIVEMEEKPEQPKSNWAITGLYFLDNKASELARELKPSARGELEMVDLLGKYVKERLLRGVKLSRGTAWLDAGTQQDLFYAATFVHTLQERQGLLISSPDEIAYRLGWIDGVQLSKNIARVAKSDYGRSLRAVLDAGE